MNTEFTKRRLEKITVKRVDGNSLTTTDHSGFGIPEHVAPAIKAGDELYLELYRFNDIAGLMTENGEYLFHRTDEYFSKRLEEYLAESKRKNLEWYEKNKEDLERRTNALSPRYKARMERFLNDPEKGEEFRKEAMGWGYELIICELAQMYERSWGAESDEIGTFARDKGTSGNQHDVAKAWAKNPDAAI